MKPIKTLLAGLMLAASLATCLGWTPADTGYNTNQFQLVYPWVNIKSGAHFTNAIFIGTITFDGTNLTLNGTAIYTNVITTNIYFVTVDGPGTNTFILSLNGFGTNTSFYGPTEFFGNGGNSVELESGTQLFGDLFGGTNLQASILTMAGEPLFPNSRQLVHGDLSLTDGGPGSTAFFTLPNVNIATPGVYGDGLNVAQVTVDAKGRILDVVNVPITGAPPSGTAGGDLTGTYPNPTIATVNASPGTYGDGTHVAVVTVNAKGQATAVSSTAITGAAPTGSAGGELAGTYPNPSFAKLVVTNGENQAITVSNQFRVDATHALVASNATPSSLASFDAANNLTNGTVSARFTFTGNTLDIASGSIPNSDLANSSVTFSGTANQITGGGTTALGASATAFALANPTLFPGTVRVSGFTNTSNTLLQGTETNSSMGAGVVHSDSLGGRSSSAVVNGDLQNSSMTIQGVSIALGASANVVSYDTNAIPSSGVLTFGHSYDTNLQADITLPAFTLDATRYETLTIQTTNSTGSDHKWTMPAGVRVAIANGGGNVIWCTNQRVTAVYVEHDGLKWTNAWKNDY